MADSRREGNSRNNSWLQLNHLFNNRGSCLSHTTDTAQEGIVPQRMHLSHTVYIHIIKRKSVQYEQLIYSGPTTLATEYQFLLYINHIKSCPSYWHRTFIYLTSPISYHLYSETSHRPFHISSILISTIYKHVRSVQEPRPNSACHEVALILSGGYIRRPAPIRGPPLGADV